MYGAIDDFQTWNLSRTPFLFLVNSLLVSIFSFQSFSVICSSLFMGRDCLWVSKEQHREGNGMYILAYIWISRKYVYSLVHIYEYCCDSKYIYIYTNQIGSLYLLTSKYMEGLVMMDLNKTSQGLQKAALRVGRLSRCLGVFTKRCHYSYFFHYCHFYYYHNWSFWVVTILFFFTFAQFKVLSLVTIWSFKFCNIFFL